MGSVGFLLTTNLNKEVVGILPPQTEHCPLKAHILVRDPDKKWVAKIKEAWDNMLAILIL